MVITSLAAQSISPALGMLLLQRYQIQVHHNVRFARGLLFNGAVGFFYNAQLSACSIDTYSYVAHCSSLHQVKIGRCCSIAHYCEIGIPRVQALASQAATSVALTPHVTSPFSFYASTSAHKINPASTKTTPVTTKITPATPMLIAVSSGLSVADIAGLDETSGVRACAATTSQDDWVEIGHDVWIGAHVKIPQGIKVGTGAVIAANTVVTADVPPYAVVGNGSQGSHIIKMRFSDELIADLLDSHWWEYDLPLMAAQNKLPYSEEDIKGTLALLNSQDKESLPRIKDKWYYLALLSPHEAYVYPVTKDFALERVASPLLTDASASQRQLQQYLEQQASHERNRQEHGIYKHGTYEHSWPEHRGHKHSLYEQNLYEHKTCAPHQKELQQRDCTIYHFTVKPAEATPASTA